MSAHPEAALYRCSACTHCFSDPESVAAEPYTPEYFDHHHRRWFAHPNLSLFASIAAAIPERASVLDVGCGRGDFLRYLRSFRPDLDLTGIDLAPNLPAEGIRFIQGDFLTSSPGATYDVVVSLAVIEHVADIKAFVERIHALTRPGGMVVIMTLNESSLVFGLAKAGKRLGVPLAFNRLYSRHHLHHFTRRSLRRLLESDRLSVIGERTHNAPLAAIDIPVNSHVADAILRSAMWVLCRVGEATDRAYLQTVTCRAGGARLTSSEARPRRT
jgi:SAM-dependent methyltransferase